MGWIGTIIVGGLVGWLASLFMKTDKQMGLIANVVIGIAGSALGVWIARLLGFFPYGGIARLIVAVAGASLLILILQKLGVMKKA
jgi:uncharacterized membrane protein YeaQ/YmgE (transglycosylase-associated protein family)